MEDVDRGVGGCGWGVVDVEGLGWAGEGGDAEVEGEILVPLDCDGYGRTTHKSQSYYQKLKRRSKRVSGAREGGKT